ncbi:hypothetical protein ASC97_30715 [Rhizobium sp. Root1203]|nr:hypothetical protein ASC97_30715 [Rhizobium sp. Root1203]
MLTAPGFFRKEWAAVGWGLFAIGVGAGDPYRQISEPHFASRQSAINVIGVLFLRAKGGGIEISGLCCKNPVDVRKNAEDFQRDF